MPNPEANDATRDQYAVPISALELSILSGMTVALVLATTERVSVITWVNAALGIIGAGFTLDSIRITTLPIEVYGFAVAGGTLRFVYDVTRSEDDVLENEFRTSSLTVQNLDSKDRDSLLYEVIIRQRLMAIFAGVCLAAGIALVNEITVENLLQIGPAPSYFAALFAGLFIKETYLSLGKITKRFLKPADDGDNNGDKQATTTGLQRLVTPRKDANSTQQQRAQLGVGLVTVLIATIVIISILSVPLEVPVYAFLGGLGYVYTALFISAEGETNTYSWIKYTFRIGLGILLAVVGHLLLAPKPLAVPVFAFLIGLFPNVIFIQIRSFAQRFFDRLPTAERN